MISISLHYISLLLLENRASSQIVIEMLEEANRCPKGPWALSSVTCQRSNNRCQVSCSLDRPCKMGAMSAMSAISVDI